MFICRLPSAPSQTDDLSKNRWHGVVSILLEYTRNKQIHHWHAEELLQEFPEILPISFLIIFCGKLN